ncbi:hypothetical protein CDD81_7999 [Ophiocordyceps australis]|uniref:G-patch domain-containing protein n=1 Tax=Ophiocordyceps australis TaxID=1399860 RepID=A0A2C5Y3E2_9HYPO|nr:hypothetical protein CDD81_7999 [Ophiocordyceps australis]
MAAPPPPPAAARPGLSLYADLHDPNESSNATISAAPVVYGQTNASSTETHKLNAALQFQPHIRRPPVKQSKSKPAFAKKIVKSDTADTAPAPPAAPTATTQAAPKTSLADWAPTEQDEWMYGTGEKRQRGGRKKKKRQQQDRTEETNWDEFYDPSKPTNVEEYVKSDEKITEVLDWKAQLYRHRKRRASSDISSDEDDAPSMQTQFAPPPSMAFAPPPMSPPRPASPHRTDNEPYDRHPNTTEAPVSDLNPPPPPPPPSQPASNPTPPPPSAGATISRAPVMYTQMPSSDKSPGHGEPPAPEDDNPEEPERSKRPGQSGFALRLMSKYGWTRGTGLGANESGIVNPLRVHVDKRRKKADADGGGWAEPAGKGKIIGGHRKAEQSKFGKMSEVIVLGNMLENMPDLQSEIANGLGQEIGEECGEKYGRVERIYIDQEHRQVFIKFTDQVSALRAVNELDERVFNGNTIAPRFYDAEKFERGVYTSKK